MTFLKYVEFPQDPSTNDYIIVLQDGYCKKCCKIYANINKRWCKTCHINNFESNFINWTSGNKKIDDFIQEIQLKINEWNELVFEWIPYYQFKDIKVIDKENLIIVHSAIWKSGKLY